MEKEIIERMFKQAGIRYSQEDIEKYYQDSVKIKEFKKSYNDKRKYCPECGSTSYSTTLMSFLPKADNLKDYKDNNITVCNNCGHKCTYHNRVQT